jgi:hypothetical protein
MKNRIIVLILSLSTAFGFSFLLYIHLTNIEHEQELLRQNYSLRESLNICERQINITRQEGHKLISQIIQMKDSNINAEKVMRKMEKKAILALHERDYLFYKLDSAKREIRLTRETAESMMRMAKDAMMRSEEKFGVAIEELERLRSLMREKANIKNLN